MKVSSQIFLVLFICGIIYVALQARATQKAYVQAGIPPVEAEVASGRMLLIIRFPPSSERQEEIRTEQDNHQATRIPADALRNPSIYINMPQSDWNNLAMLRDSWCQNDPHFRITSARQAVYEIGVNCGIITKRVEILVSDLPLPLATLIRSVPSPTCHDILCG